MSDCPTSASLTQPPVPFFPACPPITRLSLFSHNTLSSPHSTPPLLLPMPTCRRKRVVLTEPSDALLQAAASDPAREVYYLQQTGEIFESYEYVSSPFPLTPPYILSRLIELMPRACPFIALNSFSARSRGRVVLTTSKPLTARGKRLEPYTQGSPSLSNPLFLKLSNGVCLNHVISPRFSFSFQRSWAASTIS